MQESETHLAVGMSSDLSSRGFPDQRVLPDGATIVVVGGGPAGSFFAIRALRKARARGQSVHVVILEQKKDVSFYRSCSLSVCRGGCNYCAGGISPKMADVLEENGLIVPQSIVEGTTTQTVVHGDWKSIELTVPHGRKLFSVFRGSRPKQRAEPYTNFDSYLLSCAVDEGARAITGEAEDFGVSPEGRPIIRYRVQEEEGAAEGDGGSRIETIEAHFAVLAAGVNYPQGMDVGSSRLFSMVGNLIPGFRPPEVRQALICEMQGDPDVLQYMEGEMHFAQYGSKDLRIEMSSLVPKGRWVTVVLLGKSIDEAGPSEYMDIVKRFLELPHIKRLLPPGAQLRPVCLCHPNMTVGMAQNAVGDGAAVIGDMAVSRLYKDGILSAYMTATALVDSIFEFGIDRGSLRVSYHPTVKALHQDNRFGRIVFFITRQIFSHPLLSRIFYQALITERRSRPLAKRRLAMVLWRIASGDDTYRRILRDMFRLTSAWLVLVGGVLVTIRNYLTERLFGLDWGDFGRYPTGVPMEDVERKRREIMSVLRIPAFVGHPDMERMYSIRMKADEAAVFRQLGRFGDPDRGYFRPRFVKVHRIAGEPNEVGATIRYDVAVPWLSFDLVLHKVVAGRYLLYRVKNGFAQDGVLTFDIDRTRPGGGFLTIYVAFDFPTSRNPLKRVGWYLFRLMFPGYVHDVIWNHSLCELKHRVEQEVIQEVGHEREATEGRARAEP